MAALDFSSLSTWEKYKKILYFYFVSQVIRILQKRIELEIENTVLEYYRNTVK